MINKYKRFSSTIKDQADLLITSKKLNDFFSQFGDVIYTGSYALDLMTWKDIDLQIKLENWQNKNVVIAAIFNYMLLDKEVIHMEYTNSSKERDAKMPEGVYLQFRILNNREIWKMDLWILSKIDFQQNREFMQQMEQMLEDNPKIRDLILEIKFEMMVGNTRPPKMASYYLYQAILFNKIYDKEEIKNFIRAHNVTIS
jgi:hypothetical protein